MILGESNGLVIGPNQSNDVRWVIRPNPFRDYVYKCTPVKPKRILKSGNRMIVFWDDGSKTIVKRAEDEPDNDYNAFTAALAIKTYGSNSQVKKILKCVETQKEKKHGKTGKTEKETATGRG